MTDDYTPDEQPNTESPEMGQNSTADENTSQVDPMQQQVAPPEQAQPQAQPEAAPAQPGVPAQPMQPTTIDEAIQAHRASAVAQEQEGLKNDFAMGHIHPETMSSLYAKKDTAGKIGTIFGMLVSGAGSGLSHQPNALMAMMQKQIDNDFAAQQNSNVNAQNFYKLHMANELNKAQIKNTEADIALKQADLKNKPLEAELKRSLAALNFETAHATGQATAYTATNWTAFEKAMDAYNKMPEGQLKQDTAAKLLFMQKSLEQANLPITAKMIAVGGATDAFKKIMSDLPKEDAGTVAKTIAAVRIGAPEVGNLFASQWEPNMDSFAGVNIDQYRPQINSMVTKARLNQGLMNYINKNSPTLNPAEINYARSLVAGLPPAEQAMIGTDPLVFLKDLRTGPTMRGIIDKDNSALDQQLKTLGWPKGRGNIKSLGPAAVHCHMSMSIH